MSKLAESDRKKGQRVKEIRLHFGLSQEDFGERLARHGQNVSQNYISALENGRKKLGPDVQARIEAAFNVRTQWFDTAVGDMLFETPTNESDQEKRLRAAFGSVSVPTIKLRGGNLTWVTGRARGAFLRDAASSGFSRSTFPLLADLTWGFEVVDSLMLPRFPPGSYLICIKLETPVDMLAGYPYVIQTETQLLIAQYERHQEEGYQFSYTTDKSTVSLLDEQIKQIYHIEYKLAKP